MKVVINVCYGKFGLSEIAFEWLLKNSPEMSQFIACFPNYKEKCLPKYYFIKDSFPRHSPALVKVVELLGKSSFGKNAELKIVEIPDGIDYEIYENNGREIIHEKHRQWH